MIKKLMLWYNINKFYKIFGEVLGYTDKYRVSFRNLDNAYMHFGFDVAEIFEVQQDPWLNRLYTSMID